MGRKPVNKERVQNQDKRQAFIEELVPILQANGIRNQTMDQLASLAGVTKATLYKYFRSREEIVTEAVSCKLHKLQGIEPIISDTSIPYLQRYLRSVRLLIDNFSGISNTFLMDLKEMYPSLWDRINQFREYMNKLIAAFYQEGIEKGVLKDVNPAVLIMSDQIFFSRLVDPGFLEQHNLTIEQAFRDYFKVKLEGAINHQDKANDASSEIDNMLNQFFEGEANR